MTMDHMDEAIAELVDEIEVYVRGGETIERAETRLRRRGNIPEQAIKEARIAYDRKVGLIRELDDPRALVEDEYRTGGWYSGPRADDRFWWPLRRRLATALPDEDALEVVERSSTKIVHLLRPAGADEIRTRGLVLGYVQSGKTTNFMSVIAKAVDAGYRMVIVLSGITDSLRAQTQERLEETLVGGDPAWHWLTYEDADFSEHPRNANGMLRDRNKRLLAVVKKNPARLRRLARFIDAAGETVLKECPILLIDDEADQASLDIGRNRRSTINNLITRILAQPKAAYVAYTATPFANLLTNPEDYKGLYPRDFIVSLDEPRGYFGPEKIFGREPLVTDDPDAAVDDGLDVVRHVLPTEVASVTPPGRGPLTGWSPSIPDSLTAAIRWFVLATAARRAREEVQKHSTMLLHTSMRTGAHEELKACLDSYLAELAPAVASGDLNCLGLLRDEWEAETDRLPPYSLGEQPVDWTDVHRHLADVVSTVKVIVDNSLSTQRLDYQPHDTSPVIAVGGNTLSRGLTLPGLVCSYFVRTSNAYDTLLQMGRWFGFRAGYGDLVRIWMTEDLESWFYDLATVEREIRDDIRRYEVDQVRPDQLPVRIRTHPAMMITSAAKMRSAVDAEVSFSTTRQQTILFHHHDHDWLDHNLSATRRLLDAAVAVPGIPGRQELSGRHIIRNVPADLVIDFLHDYRFHEDSYRLRPDLLTTYIRQENALAALLQWSLVVVGDPVGNKGRLAVGGDVDVNRIHRSRLDMPTIAHANIKSLVSRIDRVSDLDIGSAEAVAAAGGDDDKSLRRLRENSIGDGTGLLCLYPIAADSVPKNPGRVPLRPGGKRRVPLDAAADIIGVGLFFPEGRGNTRVHYKSVDLSKLITEQADDELIQELDEADEARAAAQDVSSTRQPKRRA